MEVGSNEVLRLVVPGVLTEDEPEDDPTRPVLPAVRPTELEERAVAADDDDVDAERRPVETEPDDAAVAEEELVARRPVEATDDEPKADEVALRPAELVMPEVAAEDTALRPTLLEMALTWLLVFAEA